MGREYNPFFGIFFFPHHATIPGERNMNPPNKKKKQKEAQKRSRPAKLTKKTLPQHCDQKIRQKANRTSQKQTQPDYAKVETDRLS